MRGIDSVLSITCVAGIATLVACGRPKHTEAASDSSAMSPPAAAK